MQQQKDNILIVDDNKDILEYVSNILKTAYHTFIALNADKALTILNTEVINLVVSDVMMPNVDGFEFCNELKQDPDLCHIPVVLLTAKNTLQDKIDGLEHGADAYIEKPFSPKYLKAQISNLLNSRQLLKKHFANSPVIPSQSMARNSYDIELITKFNQIVLKNISNPELDIDFIASQLNMSRATFYRKTKGLFDMAPQELITLTRLKKAAELLLSSDHALNDIYVEVGLSSYNYFSTLFHKQFDMTPSEYIKKMQGK